MREITTAAPLVRSGAEGVFPAVTGCRLYLGVPARPSAVPHARRCVRSTLAAWQLDAVADDTELVVSELLTNAVRAAAHAAAVVVLYVALDPDWLSVLVWDSCPEPPVRPARAVTTRKADAGWRSSIRSASGGAPATLQRAARSSGHSSAYPVRRTLSPRPTVGSART